MGIKVKVNFDKRKLESAIKDQARESLRNRSYDEKCPFCHTTFSAHPGPNVCPHCRKTVDLNLNIKL